jgi:GAF domain-containing protein
MNDRIENSRKKSAGRAKKPKRDELVAALAEAERGLLALRERQSATSEILSAIAAAPGDAGRALQLIAETSARLFGAASVSIQIAEGVEFVREYRVGAAAQRVGSAYPRSNIKVGGRNLPGTVVAENRQIHIPDLDHLDPSMLDWPGLPHARAGGTRTICGTPLRREGKAFGVLIVYRDQLLPFTDEELALQQTFADQAAIAIENARLIDETNEALKQQTATADVLKTISRSVFDLPAVLDTLIKTAADLCNIDSGGITVRDGDVFQYAAFYGVPDPLRAVLQSRPVVGGRATIAGRVVLEGQIVHVADLAAEPDYAAPESVKVGGLRSVLGVPLLRNGAILGTLVVNRHRVAPFSDRQIELLRTFADQAVIAIENARLFDDVQAKSRELAARNISYSEQIEHQSATIEILKAMSASPGDAQPVFDVIVQRAMHICNADIAVVLEYDGGQAHLRSISVDPSSTPPEVVTAYRGLFPQPPSRASVALRAIFHGRVIHIPDMAEDPDLSQASRDIGRKGALAIPLLRDGQVIGSIGLSAKVTGGFSTAQIELLKTFAEQAVIAIRSAETFRALNTRTGELSEALQQQTATADVLKVISRSAFDLQGVLDTLVASAYQLCGAQLGLIYLRGLEAFECKSVAGIGVEDLRATFMNRPIRAGRGTAAERVIASGDVECVEDYFADPDCDPRVVEMLRSRQAAGEALGAIRAVLAVPMKRDGQVVGVIAIGRSEPGPFPQRQVELLQTFADQAVIAIGNTRLIEAEQQRSVELAVSLERQTATSEILRVISQSPTDARPVFESIVATAARLLHCDFAFVMLTDGKEWWTAAVATPNGLQPISLTDRNPVDPSANFPSRAIVARAMVHLPDWSTIDVPPHQQRVRDLYGLSASLHLPFLREGECVGVLTLTSRRAHAFGAAEIAQAESFRDQALIAIENARLFEEVQAKTRDLEESLAFQIATSDVLAAIGTSMSDPQLVFDRIADAALRLMPETGISLFLLPGDGLAHLAAQRTGIDISPYYPVGLPEQAIATLREKQQHYLPHILGNPDAAPHQIRIAEAYRDFALIDTAMVWGGRIVGFISAARQPHKVFSEREFQILKTFADQAVIAIQNADLFNQVQARTRDLEISLERQTATSEILRVISESPTDTRPVFEAIVLTARRVLHCEIAYMILADSAEFWTVAGARPEGLVASELLPPKTPLDPRLSFPARAIVGKTKLYVPDWSAVELPEHDREAGRPVGAQSSLYLPLLRSGDCIGALVLGGTRPNMFGEHDIALAESFRDQALIAIENARLFNETQEALERQTATEEILRAMAASPSDAQPVFESIVVTAAKRLQCDLAIVFLCDERNYWPEAGANLKGLLSDLGPKSVPIDWAANFPSRALLSKETFYLPDWSAVELPPHEHAIRELLGLSSCLYLPLLRDGEARGLLGLARNRPSSFTAADIAQAESFRDQANIALENARLFNDTKEALERQTATAEILRVISQSPTDAKPVFERIVETAQRVLRCEAAGIQIRDGDFLEIVAIMTPAGLDTEVQRGPIRMPLDPQDNFPSRALLQKEMLHLPDWSLLTDVPEHERQIRERVGLNTTLYLPLLREDECIGVLSLGGGQPNIFGPKEIAQAESFRDQAVIAIENARLFNETQEALERQTATAEILRVIASSPDDTQPVFEVIVASAKRLLGGRAGILTRFIGDSTHLAAFTPVNPEHDEAFAAAFPRPADDPITLALKDGRMVLVEDTESDDDWGWREGARLGIRSGVNVPLVSQGTAIGGLTVNRSEPGAFDRDDLELLRTFADQAVIAIENTRLLNETQEALERQTATAEILKVISASPTSATPVFDAITLTAARLFDCQMAGVWLLNGDLWEVVSGAWPERLFLAHEHAPPMPLDPTANFPSQAALTRKTRLVTDYAAPDTPPHERWLGERYGIGSSLFLPLTRGEICIGMFLLTSTRKDTFDAKAIALAESFRDQAQIAMENTRLFRETQEALAQQTATANVLKVISRSAFDLKAVLTTLSETALAQCRATGVYVVLRDGDELRFEVVVGNAPEPFVAQLKSTRLKVRPDTLTGRPVATGETIYVPDVPNDTELKWGPEREVGGFGSGLGVPLILDNERIGAFVIGNRERNAFTPALIELVKTFADQAVIAIKNVRLFEEVQARTRDLSEALQQQTATANVLQVISRSAFDLQKVLDTLIQSAVTLCGADNGLIYLQRDEAFYVGAHYNPHSEPAFVERLTREPQRPGRGSVGARVLLTGEVQQVPDNQFDLDYDPTLRAATINRAVLGVPLKRDGAIVGAIALARLKPGAFTERQIEVARTFADQAVIAIENSRLLEEVRARTRELEQSLDNLRQAQDRLVQTEKLASLGQLTAGIAHEIKNPLNFVNNFSALSRELLGEMKEALATPPLPEPQRDDVEDLMGMIDSNLEKVVHHGKRADSIVKNMLLHSREGSGARERLDVNHIVEEALNLAYHGARAEKPGFNVTIDKRFDTGAGAIEGFAQELTRVLLNLVGNGFYATQKRKAEEIGAYEPTITATTRNLGDSVEIAIRDNGTGIPDEVKAKMFNPFFTTKPAGEGTGLGLSLSHDIIVKQHGGAIEVATEPGAFTQFMIRLPRAGSESRT